MNPVHTFGPVEGVSLGSDLFEFSSKPAFGGDRVGGESFQGEPFNQHLGFVSRQKRRDRFARRAAIAGAPRA